MEDHPHQPQNYSRRDATKLIAAAGASAFLHSPMDSLATPSTMLVRKIPSTNEPLPVIGLGTWQTFDVSPSPAVRAPLKEVLQQFVEMGGKIIDSSPMYGESEVVVGDLAAELKVAKKLFMATKVWTQGRQEGISQMETSMREMRSNPLDLMQIHNLVDWQTHLTTLREWKAAGRIRYIGITHYLVSAFDKLEKIMRSEPIDFVQLNYNITTREAANRLLPLAQEKNIAVIVNRPFESGGLFSLVKDKPLPEWAREFDCASWGQFFLKYILGHPAITCVIPATSKIKHLTDNMGAGYGRLPDGAARKRMEQYIEKLT
ncbi:aldo/keto reductase [Adhaeribacter radiodurans]|uniref:Aldo/keto reductase n=1 Tax=Adhaeribacter radiodurans TaxID=2745197 RepID=A0A7L7LEH6_9BACT|nr:aldo/keto reductase [Adhaeribacter radiodurans]QMU31256.1 aldo/keto reductase [Adhaeribacter radiodurans]